MESMSTSVAEQVYHKYIRLFQSVARRYACILHVDQEDLVQDAMLRMVQRYDGLTDLPDQKEMNTFVKSTVLYLRKRAYRMWRIEHPVDGSLIRYDMSGSDNDENCVDLDSILADEDMSVLSEVYAKEMRAELERLFVGVDRIILDEVLSSHSSHKRIVNLSKKLGRSRSYVYQRVAKIRSFVQEYMNAA